MCSSKQIKELAERNAVYEFEETVNMYGKEYIRYYYNKLAELNGSINSTCNCQHNSNSRDSEPCCRCDSRQTNAGRIRNMSDEELAEFLIAFKNTFGEEYEGEASCMEWLQSEADRREYGKNI
jgi:hypothetical protein